GALTGGELAAGVPVAPATPPLEVLLPHAAIVRIAVATRPADASRSFRDMAMSSSFFGQEQILARNAKSGVPGQRGGVTDAHRIPPQGVRPAAESRVANRGSPGAGM